MNLILEEIPKTHFCMTWLMYIPLIRLSYVSTAVVTFLFIQIIFP